MARTDTLPNFLTDVADAIREKKGTEETIQASDFDTEIASISSGADISEYFDDTINSNIISYANLMSRIIKKIPDLVVADNVTTLQEGLKNAGLSQAPKIIFNSNVSNIAGLFYGNNFEAIDVTGFNTSNVTTMKETFAYDKKLVNINYSSFRTNNLKVLYRTFWNCESLIELDLSSFETPSITDTTQMFENCKSLQYLDIRNFTFDSVQYSNSMFNGVPNNCEIIVKSQTEKDWITSKFSNLTNVKTVEEYEAEQE